MNAQEIFDKLENILEKPLYRVYCEQEHSDFKYIEDVILFKTLAEQILKKNVKYLK